MFNKFIWFWNLIHYNVFFFENKITNIFYYPFSILLKSRKVRELYGKRGVNDPDFVVKDALINPNYGTDSLQSGGVMGIIAMFLCLGFHCLYTGLFKETWDLNLFHVLFFVAISLFITYYCLFKNNVYLLYFKEFNVQSKSDKVKYAWISFIFILFSLFFLISSFMYMDYLLHTTANPPAPQRVLMKSSANVSYLYKVNKNKVAKSTLV